VLLVEDSPVNLEVCVAILAGLGYVVETATNGWDALERHAERELGLIFMDCQMPEMDGYEATGEIRRREAALSGATRIPIVALTAGAMKGDVEKCMAAGMDDFISKPVQVEQLRSTLERWTQPGQVDVRLALENGSLQTTGMAS